MHKLGCLLNCVKLLSASSCRLNDFNEIRDEVARSAPLRKQSKSHTDLDDANECVQKLISQFVGLKSTRETGASSIHTNLARLSARLAQMNEIMITLAKLDGLVGPNGGARLIVMKRRSRLRQASRIDMPDTDTRQALRL